MKTGNNWKAFLSGMITMALLCALAIPTLAAGNLTTLTDVMVGGIRIVIDGQELHPVNANGNPVEPMIYKGTTYLPVRAVASALGKAVYWDGPNYTVYLGDMDGQLEYPTVMLKDMKSIGKSPATTNYLADNYGNRYGSAIYNNVYPKESFEYLLNMKYSRFKCTLYVPEGYTFNQEIIMTITADGKQVYTSPAMTKVSPPVEVNVPITGCNDFKISFSEYGAAEGKAYNWPTVCLADAGFYQ